MWQIGLLIISYLGRSNKWFRKTKVLQTLLKTLVLVCEVKNIVVWMVFISNKLRKFAVANISLFQRN